MKDNKKDLIKVLFSLCVICVFAIGLILIDGMNNTDSNTYKGKYTKSILDTNVPVISNEKLMIYPFVDTNVIVISDFYNEDDDVKKQVNSIIKFEDTFIQNTGIVYGNNNMFGVVAVLDGEVLSIENDELLKVSIEIKHSNGMVSIYQCLSDSIVKVGDIVKQGDVIGNSGTTKITDESSNQLYFELIKEGKIVNPNDYLNKEV